MKNIVTVLILCFSFIFANAQIQRTFLGNTLGVTTWNNAKSTLSQKGLEIIDCNQQAGTILVGNVTLSCNPCEFATLYFHNGLFYKIPRFQRDYSWTLEQWEDLWTDISNTIEDLFSRE